MSVGLAIDFHMSANKKENNGIAKYGIIFIFQYIPVSDFSNFSEETYSYNSPRVSSNLYQMEG